MTLRQFIRENRDELRAVIRAHCPNVGVLSESDLAEWIQNDEGLYLWAKASGVKNS